MLRASALTRSFKKKRERGKARAQLQRFTGRQCTPIVMCGGRKRKKRGEGGPEVLTLHLLEDPAIADITPRYPGRRRKRKKK